VLICWKLLCYLTLTNFSLPIRPSGLTISRGSIASGAAGFSVVAGDHRWSAEFRPDRLCASLASFVGKENHKLLFLFDF
jgi:hypothetical protein